MPHLERGTPIMSYTLIKDLYAHAESFAGQSITVSGWVRSIRDSKSLGFLVLHDGTCFATLQIVYEEGTISNFQEISRLPVGSAVIVTGEVVLTPNAKQPFESRLHRHRRVFHARLSPSEKTSFLRISSNDRPSAPKIQHLPGRLSGSVSGRLRDSPVFSGSGICLCPHAPHHGK